MRTLEDYEHVDVSFIEGIPEAVRSGCGGFINFAEPAARQQYLGDAGVDYTRYTMPFLDQVKLKKILEALAQLKASDVAKEADQNS